MNASEEPYPVALGPPLVLILAALFVQEIGLRVNGEMSRATSNRQPRGEIKGDAIRVTFNSFVGTDALFTLCRRIARGYLVRTDLPRDDP